MPLSFFHHDSRTHYREVTATSDSFGHTFGGDPSSHGLRFVNCEPMHLLYRLNQADDAVNLQLLGVRWLPLCYHFSYAAYDGTLIYRVLNDMEIELIAPAEASHNPDFPYANFPQHFPQAAIRFSKQGYDPTKAEDAVKFAALFGVDHYPTPR